MNSLSHWSYYQLTADKQREFLSVLVQVGDLDRACEAVRVRRSTVDELRRRDPKFRDAYVDAVVRAFSARVNGLAARD